MYCQVELTMLVWRCGGVEVVVVVVLLCIKSIFERNWTLDRHWTLDTGH